MPLCINVPLTVFCTGNRYRCTVCRESFTEEIPFKYPGTRITYRAANWIKGFLQQKVSIKSIQELPISRTIPTRTPNKLSKKQQKPRSRHTANWRNCVGRYWPMAAICLKASQNTCNPSPNFPWRTNYLNLLKSVDHRAKLLNLSLQFYSFMIKFY